MPEPYSLAVHAWIPVALASGQRAFVRLCDISQHHDGQPIVRIDTGRPDCDISLSEFLIGLLTVSIGPKDDREWFKRYCNPPSSNELAAALKPFEAAFILDGEGPRFFQDRKALDGTADPVSGLLIDAPGRSTTRDNADHFVKRGRTNVLSRSGAAIVLATLQTSAPSGGAGHRTSLRGGGPLSTLVVPGANEGEVPTLWQCLWANVVSDLRAEPEDASRVFPWLATTRVSDKAGVTTTPVDVHEGQAFFGMPRRIRLVFQENTGRHACDLLGIVDDSIITGYVTRPWGTNYTAWDRRHPLSPYYRPKDTATEYLPVHLQSSRIGYRQWLDFAFKAEGSLRVPAQTVADFQRRAEYLQGDSAYIRQRARMLAAGYAMDNMKPLDFGEALMPLIVGGNAEVNSQIAAQAERLIKAAEAISGQLLNSVKLALFGERAKADRDSAVLEPVRFRFWADTEQAFYDVLRDAAEAFHAVKDDLQDQHGAVNLHAGAAWLVHLKRHAFQIFDETVPIDSADSDRIEDLINARKFLVLALTGYGANGKIVFDQLNQPPPEKSTKPKKPRKPA